MFREFRFEGLKKMVVSGDITPANFAEQMRVNYFRLVAFPCAGKNVNAMPTIRDS